MDQHNKRICSLCTLIHHNKLPISAFRSSKPLWENSECNIWRESERILEKSKSKSNLPQIENVKNPCWPPLGASGKSLHSGSFQLQQSTETFARLHKEAWWCRTRCGREAEKRRDMLCRLPINLKKPPSLFQISDTSLRALLKHLHTHCFIWPFLCQICVSHRGNTLSSVLCLHTHTHTHTHTYFFNCHCYCSSCRWFWRVKTSRFLLIVQKCVQPRHSEFHCY